MNWTSWKCTSRCEGKQRVQALTPAGVLGAVAELRLEWLRETGLGVQWERHAWETQKRVWVEPYPEAGQGGLGPGQPVSWERVLGPAWESSKTLGSGTLPAHAVGSGEFWLSLKIGRLRWKVRAVCLSGEGHALGSFLCAGGPGQRDWWVCAVPWGSCTTPSPSLQEIFSPSSFLPPTPPYLMI